MNSTASHIPRYFQISNKIIQQIKNGRLLPGEKIPSENEIIKIYNVSNTTARKVLNVIESGGWVTKVKGKGTFVKDITVDRSATKVLSFTKNMLQKGLQPSTRVLNSEIIKHECSKMFAGRRYILQPPIFKITRLRFADDLAMMIENRYISMRFCPDIPGLNLEQSLYEIYKNNFNLQITRIDQTLTSILLEEDLLQHFNLKKPIPGFQVDGITFCGPDMILEMEESVYRGDKYIFTVQATP